MKRSLLALCLLAASLATLPARAATVSSLHATTLTATNRVRYVGMPVGQVVWIDCRNVLPPAATVNVYRVYSSGTDTVATVVCTDGVGRSAPTTNTWYALYGEYFYRDGISVTSCTARVITSGIP